MRSPVRLGAVMLIASFTATSAVRAGGGAPQKVLPIRASAAAAAAAPRGVVRVSVASDGTESNGQSRAARISADGRYVAFNSDATNLVAGEDNGIGQVFVHDRSTGITTRESINSSGAPSNGSCGSARISADGRFVAFGCGASNLVPGPPGDQIYVRDRQLGVTTVASVSSDGSHAVPAAGSFGVGSYAMSADGRFVSFSSDASNLVPGAPSNRTFEIYTHDRLTGSTTRDSVSASGAAGNATSFDPSISDDGRFVAFASYASNLVSGAPSPTGARIFVYDRFTGQTTLGSVGPSGETLNSDDSVFGSSPALGGDGRFLAFTALTGSVMNLYLRDRQTAQTSLVQQDIVSLVSPRLSSDGRFVSYSRASRGTTDMYIEVYDRSTGQVTTISPGVFPSAVGGNVIAFDSDMALVGSDTNRKYDIFVAPVISDPGAPNPPTNLAFTLAGSMLTLTWTAPSGAAVSDYLLEAGTVSRSTDLANFSTGNGDTRFSTPFSSRSTFYIRVRAANAAGVSVPSNEIVLTPLTLPGAPENLTATLAGNTLTLTWSQATGNLVSYIIEAGSAPGGTDLATFNTGNTNTTFTAPNVAGGTYYVRLKAVSLGGVGPASNEVSFTISGGCSLPGAPTGLTRSVAGSSVTLSWTAGTGATSYILEAGSATGLTNIAVTDLNSPATTFVTTGVPAGTYFIRVRSTNICGQSGVSNEAVAIVTAPR